MHGEQWCSKFKHQLIHIMSSLGFPSEGSKVLSVVKNLPVKLETPVQSMCREYPLEEEMATRSSILAWEIPWTEEPGRLRSVGAQSRTGLSN